MISSPDIPNDSIYGDPAFRDQWDSSLLSTDYYGSLQGQPIEGEERQFLPATERGVESHNGYAEPEDTYMERFLPQYPYRSKLVEC